MSPFRFVPGLTALLFLAAGCGSSQQAAAGASANPSSPAVTSTPWTRCSRVEIASSALATVIAGRKVTFTATAFGCSPADYRFILVNNNSGDWMVTQGWDPSPTWTWDTSKAVPGPYSIVADARPRYEPGDSPDASTSYPLAVQANPAQCASVALSADQPSPVSSGARVTVTATVSGCTAGEFRFQLVDLSTGVGLVMQDWGSSNSWTWDTTGVQAGRYAIEVDIRGYGVASQNPDATARVEIDVVHGSPSALASACTNVAVQASSPNPVTAGTKVTATATPSGCASAEFRFLLVDLSNGVGLVMQDWGSSNTWTWDTTGAQAGRYAIEVDVRGYGVASQNPDASARVEVDVVHAAPSP